MRARDHGIVIGDGTPGPSNAITDVAGVRVGHRTLIEGSGPLVVGRGPVRTGVTVILPPGNVWEAPVFAGPHRLNGNGEMTGLEWVRESGMLTTPVALTNTHSVGVVRDALLAEVLAADPARGSEWSLPVVAETWDGMLNDLNGFHVRPEHVHDAFAAAAAGAVAEGAVGAGTGMIAHGFKGGIGTASRVRPESEGGHTVGVLVLANHGQRRRFAVNGVLVGHVLDEIPLPGAPDVPGDTTRAGAPAGAGSIIVIVATDAPLLPHQCTRLAQRAGLGVARVGGIGEHTSGDLFLCFATGNRGMTSGTIDEEAPHTFPLEMFADAYIDGLFEAVVEATEEAIVNAVIAAKTTEGRDGIVAHGLPGERLARALAEATR
ncbi:MAG: P1 family peptidase [Solirubrobacterales bacterium]|nr:P1 family peptidase [Solirubrobacterales bacterium]MBV9362794.1 P1 family peptidase [Solirubrobacterales bacterium]MBV9683030.1 P1 family peptidase [Solirubrobacterales bacterium]